MQGKSLVFIIGGYNVYNMVLASCWFLACLLFGCGIYRQSLNKVRDYTYWVNFCDHLHQAIGFNLKPLPQVVTEFLPVCRGGCHNVLKGYLNILDQKTDLTRTRCQALVADTTISEFLYQLGRTGKDTEQDKIIAMRHILTTKKEQAQHNLQSKASITLKLLIIIGIAGGILWM